MLRPLVFLAVLRISGPSAGAAGPAVELRWHAPEECPGEARVVALLEQRLGGPIVREGARLTVHASVHRRSDKKYDLMLWIYDGSATRQRTAALPNCEELAATAVTMTTLAIGGDGGAPAVEDDARAVAPPKVEPAPAKEPALAKVVAPTKAAAPARRPRIRGALRLGGGVTFGDLPGVGGLARLTSALLWQRARMELEVSFAPLRRMPLAKDTMAELRVVTGIVRGCPVGRRGRVEFPVCGGLEVGVVHGRGVDLEDNDEARQLLVGLLLAPAVLFAPHPRVGLMGIVEGAVYVVRPKFTTTDAGSVSSSAFGSVRFLAALELRFP